MEMEVNILNQGTMEKNERGKICNLKNKIDS